MIRHIIYIFLLLFFSCSQEDAANINPIHFGSDDSLDIITWNIENFPKSSSTVDYVVDLVQAFNGIDIIALQEISDQSHEHAISASKSNDNSIKGQSLVNVRFLQGRERTDCQDLHW